MDLRAEVLRKRGSKLHLDDMILILKCLYPHKVVVNPYEEIIYYQLSFSAKQKLLITQLIYVSCLVNQKHRVQDKWEQIHANEEDYVNALALAARELDPAKPTTLLPNSTRRFLVHIIGEVGGERFTNRQVRQESGVAKSTVHRHLQELISQGLARQVGGYKNRGYYYELSEKLFK